MNLELEREFSKAPIIQETDILKTDIDNRKPFPADVEGKVMQKLRLEWNYNSNAIEGNKLNYGETVAFLMTGITAKGKPLKDYLDIKGHNEAINFLTSIVKETRELSETDIRALHKMILVEPYDVDALTADGKPTKKTIKIGEYKTQSNHVQTATGEIHYYASPEETPIKMRELMEWYHSASNDKAIHPIVTSALFHHKFVEIHPFDDGNGRLSRILMNLVLMQNGYPPAVIKTDDRQNYYALLSQADTGDAWPFTEYIIERVQNSLQLYLKAINGGDIDEDEDIDKEISLFKVGIREKTDLSEKISPEIIYKVVNQETGPLIENVVDILTKFDDLFFETKIFVRYRFLEKGQFAVTRYDIIDKKLSSENLIKREYSTQELHYNFKNFKNSKKMFDVDLILIIEFEKYKFSIHDSKGKKLLNKFYHESISKENKNIVIKDCVAFVQSAILNNI